MLLQPFCITPLQHDISRGQCLCLLLLLSCLVLHVCYHPLLCRRPTHAILQYAVLQNVMKVGNASNAPFTPDMLAARLAATATWWHSRASK